jgi:hypothetical protein
VTQPGEAITTALRTDAQTRLNQLLSSLSTEGATVYGQVMQTFNLAAGVTAYTLGSGGSFATTGALRAQKVTAWRGAYAGVLSSGGRVLSMEEFGAAAAQAQPGGETAPIPKIVGADTAFPLINVRVLPPPSASPGTLELAYWTPITQISDFTLTPTLPEGWPLMLHLNLAVILSPIYARQGGISPELAAAAQNSKAALVDQNRMGGQSAPQQQ